MKKMLVFCLLMICYSSFSQTEKNNEIKYWGDFGIGGTVNDDLVLNPSLNLMKNKSMYKFRFIGVSEFLILGQSESSSNLGVLYGRYLSNKSFQISFLAGLGYTRSRERGEVIENSGNSLFSFTKYEMNTFNTMSIPFRN